MRDRNLLVLVAVLAVLGLSFSVVWLRVEGMGFHMGPWMEYGEWWWAWWMPLGMVIFFVVIGVGLYLLIRGFEIRESKADRALEIARERYARGEITAEEFEKIKKSLSEGRSQ
jgi:putative membrane protein